MSVKRIAEAEWKEVAEPIVLCKLPFTPDEFTQRYDVTFNDSLEDGTGLRRYVLVEISNRKFYLQAYPEAPKDCHQLTACTLSYDPDPTESLRVLASALGLREADLPWVSDQLEKAKWKLTRLDDNGNEIEMYRFMRKSDAEWARRNYEAKGHKQSYFIKE